MNKYPERTEVAVHWPEMIRREEALVMSERLSTRLIKLAAFLPPEEFIGWQMDVPTAGLSQFDSFGSAAVRASDLEWVAEEVAQTSLVESVSGRDSEAIPPAVWDLYEIHLPAEKLRAANSIGFGALPAANGAAAAENALEPVWPLYFPQQFGELIRVLRMAGGKLRYTVGSATLAEQQACAKTVSSAWPGGSVRAVDYIGTPVRAKILLLLPNAPSLRLRTVVGVVAPGCDLRRVGHLTEETPRRIWQNPLLAARVLPEYAARILAIEPTLGAEPIVGVETCPEEAKPIPAGHKNPLAPGALKIGVALGTAGLMRDITLGDLDLRRHWQIIGQTGTGKSTLLASTLREAIDQGRGLTFFDPHGSTVELLLKTIPRRRLDRVRVVHLGDPEQSVPLSMWDSANPEDNEKTINDLNLLFAEIFDPQHRGFVGPRWERWFSVFAAATIALLGRKASFESIITVAQSKESMKKLAMATQYSCPQVSRAIMSEFVDNNSSDFGDLVSWCVSKLQRLTAIPQLRQALGAGVNALDFKQTLDTDTVTLIDLGAPALGTHAARIVGTLLLQQLWTAFTLRKSRDKTHLVALDEAHLFQTNPLPQMLAEGRKFGAAMILAHQHCGQLSPEVREALDANSANFSAFRLSVRDARDAVLKLDQDGLAKELCRLNAFNALTTLSIDGKQTPAFTLQLEPPQLSPAGIATAKEIERNSFRQLILAHQKERALTPDEVWQILCAQAERPQLKTSAKKPVTPTPQPQPNVPEYINNLRKLPPRQGKRSFDRQLVEGLGLTELTEAQQVAFMPVIQDELEARVGEAVSVGLSKAQIAVFEAIIKNNAAYNLSWLEANAPNYQKDPDFLTLKQKGYQGQSLLNETACVLWLKRNRPDFKQIVQNCQQEIRHELNQYQDHWRTTPGL